MDNFNISSWFKKQYLSELEQPEFKEGGQNKFADYSNNELLAYIKNTGDPEAKQEFHKRSQKLKALTRTDESVNEGYEVIRKDNKKVYISDKAYKRLNIGKDVVGYSYSPTGHDETWVMANDVKSIKPSNDKLAKVADKYAKFESVNEHETDPNLELKVGDYQTQHFHMCPAAKSLYQDIESKVEDMDLAVRTAKLQDALFALEESVLENGANEADIFTAETIADQIMAMAEMMGLEKEHSYIQGHVDKIKGALDKGQVAENMSLEDKARVYWMQKLKKGEIDKLPEDPKEAFLIQMMKDQMDHDKETLRRERGLEEDYNSDKDQDDMKVRIPMIMKKKGFKQISFNTGIYKGGLYVVEPGGVGVLYKKLNNPNETLHRERGLEENKLLKYTKLSSSEYQKAKKLKGFNKDDYKWDPKEDLYVKSIKENKPVSDISKHIKGIQIQLDQLGVKYEMDPKNKVRPFKVIYKPVNKDDKWYNNFNDLVFRYNLGGVVKTSLKETAAYIAETIKLGQNINESTLCKKGQDYIKARKRAGEKSSAYLSGRAVRVCKGQIEWPKKGKKK